MATAHDVAAYVLEKTNEIPALKLQKLVYYSQAWHLVWEDRPLFLEPIEAWVNGPVVRELYQEHRQLFSVHQWPKGNSANLTVEEKSSIDAVVNHYGALGAHTLSQLTHQERPWIKARDGLGPLERGTRIITHAEMAEYYSSLTPQNVE